MKKALTIAAMLGAVLSLTAAEAKLLRIPVGSLSVVNVPFKVENVSIDHLYGRVAAAGLIPYPPGIPIIMSGENFGNANSPQIAYLKSLLSWNKLFPGFEHITEGVEMRDDTCYVMCVKK